jgi:hypothetical protein
MRLDSLLSWFRDHQDSLPLVIHRHNLDWRLCHLP